MSFTFCSKGYIKLVIHYHKILVKLMLSLNNKDLMAKSMDFGKATWPRLSMIRIEYN